MRHHINISYLLIVETKTLLNRVKPQLHYVDVKDMKGFSLFCFVIYVKLNYPWKEMQRCAQNKN